MLEVLIDNIFAMFIVCVFQQRVDNPKGTNCAPLLDDLVLYSHKVDSVYGFLKSKVTEHCIVF
jgi:hypothetical protein